MLEKIGPTLVCSAITEDTKFQRALIDATHIDRLNIGADADDQAELAAAARGEHRRFPVPRPGVPVRGAGECLNASPPSSATSRSAVTAFVLSTGSHIRSAYRRDSRAELRCRRSTSSRSTRVVFGPARSPGWASWSARWAVRACCSSPTPAWRHAGHPQRADGVARRRRAGGLRLRRGRRRTRPTRHVEAGVAFARTARHRLHRRRRRRQLDGLRQGDQLPADQRRPDGRLQGFGKATKPMLPVDRRADHRRHRQRGPVATP